MLAFISTLWRRGSCNGWQCLTAAEQFGVIFSSIVVFLVLSLVYMYCLGKAVTYRRSRESVEPPQHMTSGVVVRHAATYVPTPPTTGRYSAATSFLPVFYNQIPIPYAYSYATPVVLRGIPVATATSRPDAGHQSMPGRQPPVTSSEAGRQQEKRDSETVDPNMAAERQTMPPSWRQLVGRVLRLPSGKARTIYSVSNASSPIHTEDETGSGGHADFAQRVTGRAEGAGEQEEQPIRIRSVEDYHSADPECDETEADSTTTNAATVHSDDFQMLSPPSSIDLQHAVEGTKAVSEGMQLYKSHYIPSTSSINRNTHG
ncbi:hypothetical protein E4U21_001172 [Claviceps maximensis]|nr:hypothetical protein E4U21_001172 [Claviceps maximensis]